MQWLLKTHDIWDIAEAKEAEDSISHSFDAVTQGRAGVSHDEGACLMRVGLMQVSHDDKGNTSVAFLEATDVSQPARVQQVTTAAVLPCDVQLQW